MASKSYYDQHFPHLRMFYVVRVKKKKDDQEVVYCSWSYHAQLYSLKQSVYFTNALSGEVIFSVINIERVAFRIGTDGIILSSV